MLTRKDKEERNNLCLLIKSATIAGEHHRGRIADMLEHWATKLSKQIAHI